MSKFWDKFWEKVENFFEPLGRLFDKGEWLIEYLIPVFAAIGDFVVVYTLYFFVKMHIDWYWIPMLLFICVPVLIPFNKYGYEIVKSWLEKKGKKEEKDDDENTF